MSQVASPAKQALSILHLEDNPADAALAALTLRAAGLQVSIDVVRTSRTFMDAVRSRSYDMVLCDYSLPGWNGLEALRWVRSSGFTMPLIYVSGTMGEELVECIKEGGTDYVVKENLERLPHAVRRAVEEETLRIDRDRAEQAVHRSEARYRLLFESSPQPMWVFHLATLKFLAINQAAVEHYGFLRGEFLSMTLRDLWPPGDVGELERSLLQDNPGFDRTRIWRNRTKYGNVIQVEMTRSNIEYEGLAASLVLVIDVTERIRAEDALLQSEAEHRSIVQGAPYGICRVDDQGRLLLANPALVEMLGYDSEDNLRRLRLSSLYLEAADSQAVIASWGSARGSYETKWNRRDGTGITVRLAARELSAKTQGRLEYEVFVENITEQRQLETQFRQAQKMEAVGQLAGGVAHDFNNLLMIIASYARLIPQHVDDPDRIHKYAGQIEDAVSRAAGVTQQLLAFSRRQVLAPKVVNVNTVVSDLGTMLPRLLGEDIEMAFLLNAKTKVKADTTQLEQVIMNLVVNARDAMPQGGKLTIQTADVHLGGDYPDRLETSIPAGEYLMLAVEDIGMGMDEETQAHIFEPFFSTKEDKGTGLGLSTVYGIVKQSGGYIWVYSEIGKGTTFKIYLPSIEDAEDEERPSTVNGSDQRGTETILIAEDEAALRTVIQIYLESLGYTVLSAANGELALETYRARAESIDLLITDMIMPGSGGLQLANATREIEPDLPILYISGYTDRAVDRRAFGENAGFLQKPFGLGTLAAEIRQVLSKSEPQRSTDE